MRQFFRKVEAEQAIAGTELTKSWDHFLAYPCTKDGIERQRSQPKGYVIKLSQKCTSNVGEDSDLAYAGMSHLLAHARRRQIWLFGMFASQVAKRGYVTLSKGHVSHLGFKYEDAF